MIVVGALSTDRVIGSGEGMPWDVPEEYAHFQRLVDGRDDRDRPALVRDLRRHAHERAHRGGEPQRARAPGAVVAPDVPAALRAAAAFGRTVFSAGGASVYAQTVPLAGRDVPVVHQGALRRATRTFPPSTRASGRWSGARTTRASSSWSTGARAPRRETGATAGS
jgi:dihydrofolate reductase